MKKIKILMVLIVSLLVVSCSSNSEETNKTVSEALEQDDVVAKEAISKNSIDVFGEIEANVIREIYIDFPATVEALYVKDGDSVIAGDQLIKLNYSSYTNEITKKESALELLNIKLKELEKNLDPTVIEINKIKKELLQKQSLLQEETDSDLKMLKEEIEVAETNLSKAQKDYEVYEALLEIEGISKNEVEEAALGLKNKEKIRNDALGTLEKTKRAKELEVETLAANLKVKEAQVTNSSNTNQSGIEEILVQIKIAQLEIEEMKEKLNKSYLKGDSLIADGEESVVYDISVQQGSMVGRDVTGPILRIIDTKSLIATVDIPEEFMSQIQVGSKAQAVLYADKSKVLEGKISRIANKAIEENGEVIVKADITLTGDISFIKPGYAVDVKLYTIE